MARTIKEIKADMTDAFIQEEAVISAYGLDGKKTFDQQFSKASIENILFYVFAAAIWALEKLFDLHVAEVESEIERLEPHTLLWYVNKAKAFMYGYKLVTDCDYYDTTDMSDTDIATAQIVKYAVASESNTVVYLKVAGEKNGNPCQLGDTQIAALKSYINTIKDAGVDVEVYSAPADRMKVSLKVYYDPTILDENGNSLTDGGTPVADAIRTVVANLPFNGVYRNTDLLDAVQAIAGVEVVDIISVQTKVANTDDDDWKTVVGYNRPYSGYYELDDEDIDIDYEPYDLLN